MILGHILEKIGGQPLDQLLQEQVLGPMGLRNTVATTTSAIPDPALHTFSSERRAGINIPKGDPFYEESTYWNTQWGTPMGANQTTTLDDLTTSAIKIGTGAILSDESFHAQTDSKLIGFGKKETACEPSCFTQVPHLQLRPRHHPFGRLDHAEPAAQRPRRGHGLPPRGGDRHLRGGHPRSGGVRHRPGQLPQPRRLPLP